MKNFLKFLSVTFLAIAFSQQAFASICTYTGNTVTSANLAICSLPGGDAQNCRPFGWFYGGSCTEEATVQAEATSCFNKNLTFDGLTGCTTTCIDPANQCYSGGQCNSSVGDPNLCGAKHRFKNCDAGQTCGSCNSTDYTDCGAAACQLKDYAPGAGIQGISDPTSCPSIGRNVANYCDGTCTSLTCPADKVLFNDSCIDWYKVVKDGVYKILDGSSLYAIVTADAVGNVGLGTSTPGYPLDVKSSLDPAVISIDETNAGNDYYTGYRIAEGGVEKWFIGTNAADQKLRLRRTTAGTGYDDMIIDTAGNVGIGTAAAPTKQLQVEETNSDTAIYGWNKVTDTTSPRYGVRGYVSGTGALQQNIGVYGVSNSASSNIGVKGAAAVAAGNWAGYFDGSVYMGKSTGSTIQIQDGNQGLGKVLTSDAAGLATWQTPAASATSWTPSGNDIYSANSGNVGIGTATPGQKLDVNGNIHLKSTGTIRTEDVTKYLWQLTDAADATAYNVGEYWDTTPNTLDLRNYYGNINIIGGGGGTAASTYLTVAGGGNVGIGTTAPDGRLDIYNANGAASAPPNLILSADYENAYRWKFKTVDRGFAIDLDINATDAADTEETVLALTRSTSTRPEFAVLSDKLVVNNGNVGIGQAAPTQKLEIAGGVLYNSGTAQTDFVMNSSGSDYGVIQNDAANIWSLGHKNSNGTGLGTPVLSWNSNNYVGIGMTNPNNLLQVKDLINFGNNNNTYGTAIGYQAGKAHTGDFNTFVGYQAGYSGTGGSNSALGYNALHANSSGAENTAMGMYALTADTTGNYNAANGMSALSANTTGSNNTAMGWNSGASIVGGSSNTFLGSNAGANALQKTDAVNSMALGNGAYTDTDNQVVIGNASVAQTLLNGTVGIGIRNPFGNTPGIAGLQINGSVPRLFVTTPANPPGGSGGCLTFGYNYNSANLNDPATKWSMMCGRSGGGLSIAGKSFTNDLDDLIVTADGKVGIGVAAPTTKLAVAGLGAVSYTNTLKYDTSTGAIGYVASSERYKDNIQPLADDFDKILKAEPKSFVYKMDGRKDIGFIAEEFDALGLKDLVIYDKEGRPDSLQYEKVPLYLLEVMKEMKTKNDDLEARVKALEVKLNK